jgi:hypothetical protein
MLYPYRLTTCRAKRIFLLDLLNFGVKMPSHSDKQRRFMAAAAHDPKFAKKSGIPVKVAKEYNRADKGPKLARAMESMKKDDI